jgi:serine/threonine protein kinase
VDGVTLRHEIDRGRVPVRRLLDIAVQIAEGLAAAHDAGIVHCDLKPENIMITRDGRAKILDFGLAKVNAVRGATPQEETEIGTVAGTPSYMSPEQGRGGVLDFRSDQFSFGIVLYEMAAGVHPFRRETGVQTIAAIIEDEPRPLVDATAATPAPLRWMIERCLAKDPSHRYAATADLARDLSMLRARLPEADDGRLMSTPRRWRRRVGQVALVSVLVAGVLVWGLALRPDAAPISYERLTFRPGMIHSARFAPDGETVVYSAS